ncbi:hypothetical protein AAFF_G00279570 [Aldrovandia affinis]|uniref:Uncharacterized protein n=1 Tax=Aldrovandia affinis TaxID=143900 RepID=A0AAD7WSH3_9TELE|nr:hypothetical protein AAFF_G00279570 [Aldrovandia affinis]
MTSSVIVTITVATHSATTSRSKLSDGNVSCTAMGQISLILLLSVVFLSGVTVVIGERCKDNNGQLLKTFSAVHGGVALLNCSIPYNHSAVPYNVSWYDQKTGNELRGEAGRIRIEGTLLWFLRTTLEDTGRYQCVLRTPDQCFKQVLVLHVMNETVREHCPLPYVDLQMLPVIANGKVVCNLKPYIDQADGYSIQWYKGCNLLREGWKYKFSGAKLWIVNVSPDDTGFYTCRLNFSLFNTSGYAAMTLNLKVKEEFNLRPVIEEPRNKTIRTDPGSSFCNTCRVFLRKQGRHTVDVYWWRQVGEEVEPISTDTSERVHQSDLREDNDTIEVFLSITEVKDEDFNRTYTCIVSSDKGQFRGSFTLQPSDPDLRAPLCLVFAGLALFLVAGAVAYRLLKIDIALWCRSSFPYVYPRPEADGKEYDAYVVYPRLCEPGPCGGAEAFALQTLPQVLEGLCGYRLFIFGRDSLPGEAVVDSIQENIGKSSRLLLMYTASTFSERGVAGGGAWSVAGDEAGANGYLLLAQQTGVHCTLVEESLQVILVELEEVLDYSSFPESLRHLKRRQGVARWWGRGGKGAGPLCPSSRFWKQPTSAPLTATLDMAGEFFVLLAGFILTHCVHGDGQHGAMDIYHTVEGQFFQLQCGLPPKHQGSNAALSWSRGADQNLGGTSSRVKILQDSLLFLPVALSDRGQYNCTSSSNDVQCQVSRGACPRYSADKSLQKGTNGYLLCDMGEILALDQRAEISWLKDCNPINFHEETIRIPNAIDSDAGNYTCLMKFTFEGKNFSTSRTILLRVEDDPVLLEATVIHPRNETVKVKPGDKAELDCTVFMGENEDMASETIVYWTINRTLVGRSKHHHMLQETKKIYKRDRGIYALSRLVISEVLPEFFHIPFHCVVTSPLCKDRGVVRLVPADDRDLHVYLLFCLAIPVVVVVFMLYCRFKVDVVLAYRRLRPLVSSKRGVDGKLYDAYVSTLHSEALCSSQLQDFCLQVLPEVLECHHGYKLFICGRDDLPGEAAHDVIADAVKKSRRLIIVVSGWSRSDPGPKGAGRLDQELDQDRDWEENRASYEQQIGLYDALIKGGLGVILVETAKDTDYSTFPESVRYLRRKQGALRWRPIAGDPAAHPNCGFWKCLRYRMPAEAPPQGPALRVSGC